MSISTTYKEIPIKFTPIIIIIVCIIWDDDWSWWGSTEYYINLEWR